MKIFLIRHGESTQNVFTNFENYPDFNVPLTNKGKDDAKKCGEFLIEYCKENKIDLKNAKILVSPFERTRQTAKIINTYLNIQAIKEETLLIERQFGLFDNKTFEEREKYKDAFEFQNWMYEHGGNFYTKFPLGESNFDVYVRAKLFLNLLLKDVKNDDSIFIVSHGAFLKCLQMAYFNYSPEWFNEEPFMNNCEVRLIERNNQNDFDKSSIYKIEK